MKRMIAVNNNVVPFSHRSLCVRTNALVFSADISYGLMSESSLSPSDSCCKSSSCLPADILK